MSELISKAASDNRRRYLLATVSTIAIIGLGVVEAEAGEATEDRPTVWIELGGQLDHLGKQADPYIPPFAELGIQNGLISPAVVQKPSNYALGEEGSIRFQPHGSEWSLSASLRYGRSSTKKRQHQEVSVTTYLSGYPTPIHPNGPNQNGPIPRTADYTAKSSETHSVVDFQVGRDVGLGVMSPAGVSRFDVGIRFAQFTSRSNLTLLADPNPYKGFKYFPSRHRSLPVADHFQFYRGYPDIRRSFNGIGPSAAWSGSVPIATGGDGGAEVSVDFGANLAVLFGRQKVRVEHQTTADRVIHTPFRNPKYIHDTYSDNRITSRSRSVVIPNIGGEAGISLNFPNAKVSVGYRADFFLGAMDGGIDTYKGYDRNFYGPFATISIGLGN